MFLNKSFLYSFGFFIFFNIFLYLFIGLNYKILVFQKTPYLYSSHHYIQDNRVTGGKFNLLQALGNYDAQWYLRIADAGYPNQHEMATHTSPFDMEGLSYAFFPLYPILLHIFNFPIGNILLSAFLLANLLLLVNFVSLYYVVTKFYSQEVALKTNYLLFLYPFSIFYRSYFSEGLFLFLLIWFSYFLIQRKLVILSFLIGLLFITRPTGVFLAPLFLIHLFLNLKKKKYSIGEVFGALIVSGIPFACWTYFNYKQAGNPMMWHVVEAVWYKAKYPLQPIVDNVKTLGSFFSLSFHSYHSSKVDTSVFMLSALLLFLSRKYLKWELWMMALILVLASLLVKDFMSYVRYQMVAFPLFVYLAGVSNKYIYTAILILFTVGLFVTSLFFVNWFWIA